MSTIQELLQEITSTDGPWVEIDGDDFDAQEREDGMRFHASAEVRVTQPAGWQSHYYAVLDTEGDWDDPDEYHEDDEEDGS